MMEIPNSIIKIGIKDNFKNSVRLSFIPLMFFISKRAILPTDLDTSTFLPIATDCILVVESHILRLVNAQINGFLSKPLQNRIR